MMTRKDYVKTAEILNGIQDKTNGVIMAILVADFGLMFKNDNPRFDYQKFAEACYKK